MLDVVNRQSLVVGGGAIGARKVAALLQAGAQVTCISKAFCDALQQPKTGLTLICKPYDSSDIANYAVVIAATDCPHLNGDIYAHCRDLGVLCQTVDRHSPSDFDFMAHRRWQDLLIAVSTFGRAPRFAKAIVRELSQLLTPSHFATLQREKTLRFARLREQDQHNR